MRFNVATAALAAAPLAAAQNFGGSFPLTNGFPNPSPDAIATIQDNAEGYLPNVALPTELSDSAATAFQLIALNEIFEVAYFSSLLTNITHSLPGYAPSGVDKKYLTRTFFQIRAQEEIHALAANAVLKAAGRPTIGGCKYNYMAIDLTSGIHNAQLFTDVVIGALAEVQMTLAMDGGNEIGLVPVIGSIIGMEAEQVGYFRYFQDLAPSAAPLLTTTPAAFAYNALRMFIVPGSCPTYPNIPTLPGLTVVTKPQPMTMDLQYSVEGEINAANQAVTYLSGGGRKPVSVPITNVQSNNGMTTFTANFPYDNGFANGLSFAAVTKGMGPFTSGAEAAAAAVYGPGLIEVM